MDDYISGQAAAGANAVEASSDIHTLSYTEVLGSAPGGTLNINEPRVVYYVQQTVEADTVPTVPLHVALSSGESSLMATWVDTDPPAAVPGTCVETLQMTRPLDPLVAGNGTWLIVPGAPAVRLDRDVILGRRPHLDPLGRGAAPMLVTVPSPGGGVSANHLRLRVEDDALLAIDLDSANGTWLRRAGRQSSRLRPHEEILLIPGDRLDLGEGVLLGFEGMQ